jgi:hypothetical protein
LIGSGGRSRNSVRTRDSSVPDMARAGKRRPLVGSRTGARRRRFSLSVPPRFLWECLTSRIVRWFPAPASSNAACRFPALGFPVCFTSRVMWPTCSGWLSADGSSDPVLVRQSECVIEPLRIPPLPAESFAPSGALHLSSCVSTQSCLTGYGVSLSAWVGTCVASGARSIGNHLLKRITAWEKTSRYIQRATPI